MLCAGAMDGVVQLHALDVAPQAVKPGWRRGRAETHGPQVQRLPCHTTEFRCHRGRVKVSIRLGGVSPFHHDGMLH